MKLTAQLAVTRLIDENEEERPALLELSCENFEDTDLKLKLDDGHVFVVDANELIEAAARLSNGCLFDKKAEK